MNPAPHMSVLLPVYNEEDNVEALIREIENALTPLRGDYEIIAIDDGSKDKSFARLAEMSRTRPHLKLIKFRRNFGQTAAFDAGFAHAKGRILVTMDADLQNDPRDIVPMMKMLDEGYDFVTGWRKDRKDAFLLRRFPSVIANWIIRKVTRTPLHDQGCSLKIYRREITEELRLYGEMHRFLSVLVQETGARVGEYVVNHRSRNAGVSKYGIGRTFKVLLDLLTVWFFQRFRTKPVYVFGGFGLGLEALSVLLAGIVGWQKLALEVAVHRNPLFLIALLFSIVGFQFLALGLIAELIMRTYFESQNKAPYFVAEKINFS